MTAALPLETARRSTRTTPNPPALAPTGDPVQAARLPSRGLDLSRSRTHYAALDILRAYKLSGNFHANLETVLKDIGVFDKVTYQIDPSPTLSWPDRRHVVFRANENMPRDMFENIIRSIAVRIGFDEPWWSRLLRRVQATCNLPALGPTCRIRH
jgi:hypothetical protein